MDKLPECPAHKCIDAKWDEWTDWSECSSSCGANGWKSRSREVKRWANECGHGLSGMKQELERCNRHSCQ